MVKMNITIQLDDNDISLTELLSAIIHKEHVPVNDVPVVKVEEPTPQKQEEEAPTKKPRKKSKARKNKNYVCRKCGATESSQWRQRTDPRGTMCNICHMKEYRQMRNNALGKSKPVVEIVEEPVEKVEVMKKPVVKPRIITPKRRTTKPKLKIPRKKKKENQRPELRDIGGLVDSDRLALLKNSNFNTVRRFAQAHPDKLMSVMGCSLNELEALENAQRKAAALHRKYSMISAAERNAERLKDQPDEKPKWEKSKTLSTVWNGIEGREVGAYMLSDVVDKAYHIATTNYEDTPKKKKFKSQLLTAGQEMFEKIVKAANSPNFSILGMGDNIALLVLNKKDWPTLRDIEA